MEKVQISAERLRTLLGLSDDQFEAMFTDAENADSAFETAFRDRVKARGREQFQLGEKKAKQQAETALAPLLSALGIEAEETLVQTIEKLPDAVKQAGKGSDPASMTKEQLQSHPLFAEAAESHIGKVRAALQAKQAELDNEIAKVKAEVFITKAVGTLAKLLKETGAVLGAASPETAASMLLKANPGALGLSDSGDVIVIGPDGKPAADEITGKAIDPTTWLKSAWSFGFNDVDPGKAGGGAPAGKPPGGGTSGKFKTLDEAKAAAANETDPAKKAEIFKELSRLAAQE